MSWQGFKQSRLASLEKAGKDGELDSHIAPLIGRINKNPGLVTTSSCSGRIVLLIKSGERKNEASFYSKWHDPVKPEEFELRLGFYNEPSPLWFRVEPFILHVAAKDLKSASGFMKKIRAAGVKRGGIQTITKSRAMIEVQGTGHMAVPAEPIDEWNGLVNTANKMMEQNLALIRKLEKIKW